MLDFISVTSRLRKDKTVEVYPKFLVKETEDLMIRGKGFYAVWDEASHLWSTDEYVALRLIDAECKSWAESHTQYLSDKFGVEKLENVRILCTWDSDNGIIDKWHKYCQKQMWDNFVQLDEKIIFSNEETTRKDFASKKLPYAISEGDHSAWDTLMGTLYAPDERRKIEWTIGAIVTGDSKDIQKFLVLYGSAGTGKSTILKIIEKLFEGYCATFDAKALGSSSNAFALEAFRSNPLVAIQHDGDLSKIEDNTRINSLVSHETMMINEKFKSAYASRFNSFLLMGTNKPVKITDAKSGLLRRLIDVSPTGEKIPKSTYNKLVKQVDFELGAIAFYCRDIYLQNKNLYDTYRPLTMMGATNDFYLFVYDKYYLFKEKDEVALSDAWSLYKDYCEEAKVQYMYPLRQFREEMRNYFREFHETLKDENGNRRRNIYIGFREDKFVTAEEEEEPKEDAGWLKFEETASVFDKECLDYPAQLAEFVDDRDKPKDPWSKCKTVLAEIDTSQLHYVRVPINHIVIDFDIPDESGNKCLELNLKEANKFPPTYAELSKSGQGIHLHYIYDGDVEDLSSIYAEHIEVKIFKGKSSLRRKLSKCNTLPIAHIASGLPKKEVKKVVDEKSIKSEAALRALIERHLRKEIMGYTKPSIDMIKKILDQCYDSELSYDVSDMFGVISAFAMQSSNQAEGCMKQIAKMHLKSKDVEEKQRKEVELDPSYALAPIIFFDVEVFKNLFIVCWKKQGKENDVVCMINPTPAQILNLTHYRLIGFNNRKYDNHILYARLQNYSEMELYQISQAIINGLPNSTFSQAYNLSYTDIYDFSSTKQSLKKFEIKLGIHHQELGIPWDQEVPKEMWQKVGDYCKNDVLATEAVFNALQDDWFGRQMLVDMANLLCKTRKSTVNDTTNQLTSRIIFGGNNNPQSAFNYRDLSKPVRWSEEMRTRYRKRLWPIFDAEGQPTYQRFDPDHPTELPEGYSIMPFWPDYSFDPTRKEKSLYLGEEVGEGGRVYANPGMYGDVYLDDIASMHPSTIEAEDCFGPEYTQRFADLKQIRIDIKHNHIDEAKSRLGGVLASLFEGENFTPKKLSKVLKIPINAVYGQTAAKFSNPFRDPRNVDNLVAKRGALFMMNLEREVKKRGFTVAHIKTDSIKIPDATPEIMDFVEKYGLEYGYSFEHEATYEKMCLVNNAVYIAKYKWADDKDIKPGTWTATGTQFKVPYVFKSLFSHEPLKFEDYCVTQESHAGALYLNYGSEETPDLHFVGKVGQFTPVVKGGGELLAQRTNKKTGEISYAAVSGSTGYRFVESESIAGSDDAVNLVDISYFKALADEAVTSIEQYGGFQWFVSDIPYERYNNDILPF